MALKLDVIANMRQFVQEMKKGGASVEDISDELNDMAKDGERATEKVEKSFREMAKASDKSAKEVKSNFKEGFKGAADEAGQSGREAAASFSGGFDDVAGAVQETLANALGGFGPVGAAAGVAIAAALGAALQGAADAQEKLQAAREAAAELSQTLYENGGELPIQDAISKVFEVLASERGAQGPFESFLNQWMDLGDNLDAVKVAARQAKTPVSEFIRGLSGADLTATAASIKAVDDAIKDLTENAPASEAFGQLQQLESIKTQLETVQTSAELADEYLGAVGSTFQSAEYVAKVDALGQAWQDAMVDAGNYIAESEEGITTFDWGSYLADAEATLAAATEYQRKIVTLPTDIQAEGERIFAEQGAQAALAYTTAYEAASEADKSRFVAAAKQNGEAAGTAQGTVMAANADRAARDRAAGMPVIPLRFAADLAGVDWSVRNYRPPPVTINGVIKYSYGSIPWGA